MKRWLLFALIVGPIVYLLTFGLMRNARELPSVLVGKTAPPFSLETLDNKIVNIQSFEGKSLVINFWATWCGPCFYEHPVLKQAQEIYKKDGVQILGVVYQDKKEVVAQFLEEYGEPFLVALDPRSKMAIDYGVGGVPETFFIDSEGIVRAKFAGVLTIDKLKDQIELLVTYSRD